MVWVVVPFCGARKVSEPAGRTKPVSSGGGMLGLKLIATALVVVHPIVSEAPARTGFGVAVSTTLGAVLLTVTLAVAGDEAWPLASCAIKVYVVVAAGFTETDPFAGLAPIPMSIVTPVAFMVCQLSVTAVPGATVLELAANETTVG